jgi:LacI family transcriptional regulator
LPDPADAPACQAPQRSKPPIALVAERAAVSIATVSRVLNGVARKASPATIARVREAADALGYRALDAGRALRRQESRIVVVLASNLANPAMAAIAASAEAALREAGLVMVLCDTQDRADLQDLYLLEMRSHRPRAFVLLAAVASPRLADMRAQGEPMLFVTRRCPGDDAAPFVGIDNEAAGRAVARAFAERGARRIGLIHGMMSSSATADRVHGFRDEAVRRGLAVATAALHSPGVPDHLAVGYAAMGELLAGPRLDGLFCSSDLIAYGAHRRATEAGLAIPRDLAVVGFDDNPLNAWLAPWLSSVKAPYEAFGQAIASSLSAKDGAKLVLTFELVMRAA